MSMASFMNWLKSYKRPQRTQMHEDGRSFVIEKPYGVNTVKPFPPPPVPTFKEAVEFAKAALDRAEQPFPKTVMVHEGPRAYVKNVIDEPCHECGGDGYHDDQDTWAAGGYGFLDCHECDATGRVKVLNEETSYLQKKLYESLSPEGQKRVVKDSQKPVVKEEAIDDRPLWPEVWMQVACTIARKSYDPRLKVGAIIVSEDNTRVLSVGYNGNYRGGPNEPESLEPGKSGMIHAEQNALVKCDFNFSKKKHMYLTHSPCRACAKLIINAEISRVVYNEIYRDPSGIELLKSAGVEVYSTEEAILKAKL